MNDWSKDIDLETIKEYLQECAENDDYHYEQYQVDLVMHEYIRQKQIIERLNKDLKDACEVIERLKEDKKKAIEYIEEKAPQSLCLPNGVYDMRKIDKTELLNILKGSDKKVKQGIYMCDEEGNEWVDKKTYNSLYEEYEKANNIIKEVREYVSRIIIDDIYTKCILEILDKVDKDV